MMPAPAVPHPQAVLNQYTPAPLTTDGFHISSAEDQGDLRFGAQVQVDYADDPLVYVAKDASGKTVAKQKVVHQEVTGRLILSLGIANRLVLFGGIPMDIIQRGDSVVPTGSYKADGDTKLGDAFAGGRLRLFGNNDDLFQLAAQVTLTFPSGRGADRDTHYVGERSISGHPQVILQLNPGPVRIVAQGGVLLRRDQQFLGVTVGDFITAGLGVDVDVIKDKLQLLFEVRGATRFHRLFRKHGNALFDHDTSPLEALGGIKYHHPKGFSIGAAAGPGLLGGWGSPDYRVIGMLGWTKPPAPPPPPPPADTDGDGVTDDIDQCPNVAGPAENHGCPWGDADGDGVTDNLDKCPNTPGPAENDGCPWPDTDGDGVTDNVDQCPKVAGPKENNGCPWPDRDGDGVPDRIDNCPDEPGTAENQGCAEVQKVIIRQNRLEILDKVYFRTGSSRIRSRSYKLLDNIAQVINAHPEITKVTVEGYTDSVGNAKYNKRLSERRAASVVRYLERRGHVDKSRLESKGFGEENPLVPDAKTKDELAQNRRVEFKIQVTPPEGSGAAAPSGDQSAAPSGDQTKQ